MILNASNAEKQGKSEGFDSCDRPNNLTQIGLHASIFSPYDFEIWWKALEKWQSTSFTLHQALCIISNSVVNSNWSYCPETLNSGQNQWFFVPCDLKIWWMVLKNNTATFLCEFKLCASFQSHRWIQTRVTVWKCSIRVKIDQFLSCATLTIDG